MSKHDVRGVDPKEGLRHQTSLALREYQDLAAETGYKSGLDYSRMDDKQINEMSALPVNHELLDNAVRAGDPTLALEHYNNLRQIFGPQTGRSVEDIKSPPPEDPMGEGPTTKEIFARDLSGVPVLNAAETALKLGGKEKDVFRVLCDRNGTNPDLLRRTVEKIRNGKLPANFFSGSGEDALPPTEAVRGLKELRESALENSGNVKAEDEEAKGEALLKSFLDGDNATLRDFTKSGLELFVNREMDDISHLLEDYDRQIADWQRQLDGTYSNAYGEKSKAREQMSATKELKTHRLRQLEILQEFASQIDAKGPRTFFEPAEVLPDFARPRKKS